MRVNRLRRSRASKPTKDITRFHETMQLLERGASEQEVADAAAALTQPVDPKQGRLL